MKDRTIGNDQITSSPSSHRENSARLHIHIHNFWYSYEYYPWIEADLKSPKTLTGILIQGDSFRKEWVTSLQIKTGNDRAALQYITEDNGDPTVNSIGLEIKCNCNLI